MADLHIGAARYQLLEGLWRGRDRVIYDPELLAQVLETDGEDASASRGVALLQELFMGDGAVWIVVDGADDVMTYARALPDARLVTLAQAAAIGLDPQWTVAMFAVDAAAGSEENAASVGAAHLQGVMEQFVTERGRGRAVVAFSDAGGAVGVDEASFEAWTQAVMGEPRTFVFGRPDVVTVHAVGARSDASWSVEERTLDEDDEDDEDGETTYFVRRTRAGAASPGGIEGRWGETLGASKRETPAGASTLPARGYDEDLDEAEQSWTGRGERLEPPPVLEDVTVSYDNQLTDDAPSAVGWMAVLGGPSGEEGVTLVDLGVMMPSFEEPIEVPAGEFRVDSSGEPSGQPVAVAHGSQAETFGAGAERSAAAGFDGQEREALLARLAHARARADEAVIERQRLLEELDLARADASPAVSEPLGGGDAALAEAQAELQSLRWSLEQARAQVETLRARGVDAHEREVAVLHARLERLAGLEPSPGDASPPAGAGPGTAPKPEPEPEPDTQMSSAPRGLGAPTGVASDSTAAARVAVPAVPAAHGRREWKLAVEEIQILMRRLERGGGSALEIHRALRGLLGRLRRLG